MMNMADDAQLLAARPAPGTPRAARFGEGFVMDAWYVAALSPDLKPGKMEGREYLGEPVLIGRTRAGAVYALRDVCPHRAAKLSAGKVRAEALNGENGAARPSNAPITAGGSTPTAAAPRSLP